MFLPERVVRRRDGRPGLVVQCRLPSLRAWRRAGAHRQPLRRSAHQALSEVSRKLRARVTSRSIVYVHVPVWRARADSSIKTQAWSTRIQRRASHFSPRAFSKSLLFYDLVLLCAAGTTMTRRSSLRASHCSTRGLTPP